MTALVAGVRKRGLPERQPARDHAAQSSSQRRSRFDRDRANSCRFLDRKPVIFRGLGERRNGLVFFLGWVAGVHALVLSANAVSYSAPSRHVGTASAQFAIGPLTFRGHRIWRLHDRGRRAVLMHLNIWVILAALLALLVIARYMQHQETPRICVDDPTASVCHR